jgi:hypothetical protein
MSFSASGLRSRAATISAKAAEHDDAGGVVGLHQARYFGEEPKRPQVHREADDIRVVRQQFVDHAGDAAAGQVPGAQLEASGRRGAQGRLDHAHAVVGDELGHRAVAVGIAREQRHASAAAKLHRAHAWSPGGKYHQ